MNCYTYVLIMEEHSPTSSNKPELAESLAEQLLVVGSETLSAEALAIEKESGEENRLLTSSESPKKENNNDDDDKEEARAVDPDSPDGVYMDRDELIQSILNEPFNPPISYSLRVLSSSSDNSEFDMSDDRDDFELWSSDSASPEPSEDSDVKIDDTDETVELNEKAKAKKIKIQQKIVLPPDYWKDIQQSRIQKFDFLGSPHVVELEPKENKENITPLDCYKLFVNDDVISLMVTETNSFARSKFVRPGYHKDFLTGWIDVTNQEMREFVGLLIFMSSRRLPGTKYYWSGDRDLFSPVAGRIMTETRFKRLMTFWHFGDDKAKDYPKIKNLLNLLNDNFKKIREPEQVIYVAKEVHFLRDHYAFQRLIAVPKRGQKILRLLDSDVYTYKIVIMPPENCDDRVSKTKQAVFNILEDYLNQGRSVVFHNLFISVDLAQDLINNKTHSVGYLRKKARNTPAELYKFKVRNNEVKGLQNSEGISILKYKIWGQTGYGLSTYHGTETVQIEKVNKRNGKPITKEQPKFLRDFSLRNKVFDLAEKYLVIESPLNNETTWYRRLANDLLTGTCVSNAFCLYKKLNGEKCKFYKFQDQLWRELVGFRTVEVDSSENTTDEEG